ncbi:hypothetical protein ACHHYP_00478 [Achlya hypogyna]|uniref:Uncharacterized protein n=1 Tax=Achlya hypogyna TaxID=1202772 RepID=A0A1V9ZAQ1_ACHHY|nr:hypothetical protein ACHHYP_00478 [Achlya hypogyna]
MSGGGSSGGADYDDDFEEALGDDVEDEYADYFEDEYAGDIFDAESNSSDETSPTGTVPVIHYDKVPPLDQLHQTSDDAPVSASPESEEIGLCIRSSPRGEPSDGLLRLSGGDGRKAAGAADETTSVRLRLFLQAKLGRLRKPMAPPLPLLRVPRGLFRRLESPRSESSPPVAPQRRVPRVLVDKIKIQTLLMSMAQEVSSAPRPQLAPRSVFTFAAYHTSRLQDQAWTAQLESLYDRQPDPLAIAAATMAQMRTAYRCERR